jgi:hypothetical protein
LYYVQANGPPGVAVPLIVDASGSVTVTGTGAARASELIGRVDNPTARAFVALNTPSLIRSPFDPCISDATTLCVTDGFKQRFTFVVVPGQPEPVLIGADSITIEGTSQATADPVFRIDPAFALADQYTLSFSDGILNTAPTPEPSTLVLFASSLIGAASVLWRGEFRRSPGP